MWNFMSLASLWNWADQFESYLVENSGQVFSWQGFIIIGCLFELLKHTKLTQLYIYWMTNSLNFWYTQVSEFLTVCSFCWGTYSHHTYKLSKKQNKFYIWASSWDYGPYRIGNQRRVRQACASPQSRQSLCCSHTWSMEVDKGSNQKSDV